MIISYRMMYLLRLCLNFMKSYSFAENRPDLPDFMIFHVCHVFSNVFFRFFWPSGGVEEGFKRVQDKSATKTISTNSSPLGTPPPPTYR